ncbi:4-coumarate-CoA ligase [Aspergillus transmontanensis]|uniref:4-coumarate-CoA ligase n=1 Tax=Aspergillus transmontanensis TaxID=1034304 RepID=A0A5N6W6W6_9EURO|nr:4-coumarate-CoA ligase [Aspergillus transmontanensis]
MPYKSRWRVDVPNTHLASILLTSPTAPLSKTDRCFLDAGRPDTHYFTTHDFRLWSQRFAAGLRKSGLCPGDRVLMFSGNDLFFPVVFMGIIMAGGDSGATYMICARASLDTGLEAARLVGLSRDRVSVFDNTLYDGHGVGEKACRYWGELVVYPEEGEGFAWDELSTPELADRTLALNYSSGTKGRHKGVEITHKNYVTNLLQFTYIERLRPNYEAKRARKRCLCFLPMYHSMAQMIMTAATLALNTPGYIMPKFDFIQMLGYTQKYRITDYVVVPPIVVALAKHPAVKIFNLSSVEDIGCGTAPLSKEVSEQLQALWPPGKNHLFDDELGPQEKGFSAAVGELNANCEAKSMAEDGVAELLERNQRGELWLRGQNVMKGYWQNPEATKATKTEDGWLKTGDVAFVADHDKFHVVDRLKVAPAKLEALLLEHPAVTDAAVIGIATDNDERPRAYVVLKSGQVASAKDIFAVRRWQGVPDQTDHWWGSFH